MKKRLLFLFSLFIFTFISISPVYAINNPRNMYDVKPGDYLWKIAKTYETTVEDLKQINGLQSDSILVGQKLRVPVMYEVVKGDTLWGLSQSFNSTVQLLNYSHLRCAKRWEIPK